MSEQELTKWKNKLKLWMIMHPNTNPTNSLYCTTCSKMPNCRKLKEKLRWDGKTIYISEMQYQRKAYDCIEWIKDV